MKNRLAWAVICLLLIPAGNFIASAARGESPGIRLAQIPGLPAPRGGNRGAGGQGMGGKALNNDDLRRAMQWEMMRGRSGRRGVQRGASGTIGNANLPQGNAGMKQPPPDPEAVKRAEQKEQRKARLREQVEKKKAEAREKAEARKARKLQEAQEANDAKKQADDGAPKEP